MNSMIRFHIFKSKHEVVYSSKHELPWFKVNKNWLVLVEGEEAESIIVENLRNGEKKMVASGGFLYAPALDGNYLAYVENKKGGKSQVILYNLKTEQKKVVTTLNQACLYNNFLHLSEGKMVWTDIEGEPWHDLQNDIPGANGPWMGVGYYYLCDIKKDKICSFRHTDKSYFYPGYAEYSQGKIFSINFQDHRDWNPQQFGYFSLADKKFCPLVSPSNVGGFRVFGDYLAIKDDKGMQL